MRRGMSAGADTGCRFPGRRLERIVSMLVRSNGLGATLAAARLQGAPNLKLKCLVLCRKISIPAKIPKLPPVSAIANSMFSGIRRPPRMAWNLS